ncbi:hypothetical protein TNCV_864621 [Trichonephila clavipes]|nr:hypothetical protein TNCV_864621 [Trichonephila clavipes]
MGNFEGGRVTEVKGEEHIFHLGRGYLDSSKLPPRAKKRLRGGLGLLSQDLLNNFVQERHFVERAALLSAVS